MKEIHGRVSLSRTSDCSELSLGLNDVSKHLRALHAFNKGSDLCSTRRSQSGRQGTSAGVLSTTTVYVYLVESRSTVSLSPNPPSLSFSLSLTTPHEIIQFITHPSLKAIPCRACHQVIVGHTRSSSTKLFSHRPFPATLKPKARNTVLGVDAQPSCTAPSLTKGPLHERLCLCQKEGQALKSHPKLGD